MTLTAHIPYLSDLYEVRYTGSTILSIQKWYGGTNQTRQVSFLHLPKELQIKIVTQMRKHGGKTKG